MDELISKQALKEDLLKRGFYPVIVKCALEDAPAVDAVEVVRCKDCRRFKPHEERPEFGFCKLYPLGLAKHENGFCEHGERKTDA